MVGSYRVRVRNKRNTYDFTLHRNITVLCGDSGRGKTTLFDMIAEYGRLGKESGVSVSCDRKLIAISGEDWESKIEKTDQSIVVIDEDSAFLRSRDFARAVRESTNYYLLITRNFLAQLPYSVDEIYRIEGKKNKTFVPVYTGMEHVYDHISDSFLPFYPDLIITEDSRAGFQFFSSVAAESGIECISAKGKSNVYQALRTSAGRNVVVIADGAAFGAEIRDIVQEQALRPQNVAIFLPESFEWIILTSGAAGHESDEYLTHPEQYAESSEYLSWERYFTEVLRRQTAGSVYMQYSKEKLSPYYLQDRVKKEICDSIKGIRFNREA